MRLLLYQNAMEGVPNEEGQLPIDVTASDEVREEVSAASAMTSLLGRDFAERDKARARAGGRSRPPSCAALA